MSEQELVKQWTDALSSSNIPKDLQRAYAESLGKEYISLELGRTLSDEHLTQVGIRIGHRAIILRNAANHLTAQAAAATGTNKCSALTLSNARIAGVARVLRTTTGGVTWESISGTADNFQNFAAFMSSLVAEYRFPASFNKCWEDNKPMPFNLRQGSNVALLLRIPDLSNKVGTTLASITNRVVILFTGTNILTYHRCSYNPFQELETNFQTSGAAQMSQPELLEVLVRAVLDAYIAGHEQLQQWSDSIDELTDKVDAAEEFTQLQKQASVYQRCLHANITVIDDLLKRELELVKTFEDVLKDMQTTKTKIDEVQGNAVGSIDLLIALDDFKNGSNLKLFTYISVICQPIGVATGWYGMNFRNMPDLQFFESYYIFITCILLLCGVIVAFLLYHAYKK